MQLQNPPLFLKTAYYPFLSFKQMPSDNFPRLFLMEPYEYQSKISQNPMLIPCLIQVKREFDLACCQPPPALHCALPLISIIDNFISQKSLKYNHIVIQQGLCVLVSKYFFLGKKSPLVLHPTGTGRPTSSCHSAQIHLSINQLIDTDT